MSEVEKTPEELAVEAQLKAEAEAKLAADKAAKAEEKARASAEKKAAKEVERKEKAEAKAKERAEKLAAKNEAAEAKRTEREAAKLEQNGVSRPLTGATKQVWDIADKISQETRKPAERKDVIAQGEAAGLQSGTINTQYGRWRKYNGLTVAREAKPVPTGIPQAPEGTQPEVPETAVVE